MAGEGSSASVLRNLHFLNKDTKISCFLKEYGLVIHGVSQGIWGWEEPSPLCEPTLIRRGKCRFRDCGCGALQRIHHESVAHPAQLHTGKRCHRPCSWLKLTPAPASIQIGQDKDNPLQWRGFGGHCLCQQKSEAAPCARREGSASSAPRPRWAHQSSLPL